MASLLERQAVSLGSSVVDLVARSSPRTCLCPIAPSKPSKYHSASTKWPSLPTPRHAFPLLSHRRSLVLVQAAAVGVQDGSKQEDDVAYVDLSDIEEWQLDFCSRPILDERGKKVWELVVCDGSRRLEWAEYFPNNKINSVTLREALLRICDETGAPRPRRVKFFRAQMQNIISKACVELEIKPIPSRRTLTLQKLLEERFEDVYSKHPGFQAGAAPLLQLDPPIPETLPDALAGERWALVELPLSALLDEAAAVNARKVYGSTLDLEQAGLNIPPDTIIPGLAVFSGRATAVAARMASMELGSLEVDAQRGCMVLNVGVAERWRYASYRRNKQTDLEAQKWDEAKNKAGGLHFLALQKNENADKVDGLWMLLDSKPLAF